MKDLNPWRDGWLTTMMTVGLMRMLKNQDRLARGTRSVEDDESQQMSFFRPSHDKARQVDYP